MSNEKTKQEIQEERREARRRRRVRNQVLAYLLVIVLIIGLAAGVVYGIHYVTGQAEKKEQNQQSQQNAVDEILQGESELQEPSQEPTPEPTPEVIELTYEQKLDQIVNAAIEVMPIEDKVAGLFFVSPESVTGVKTVTQAGDETREALSKYAVGGILYAGANIAGAEEFKTLLDNTELYSKYPVFLAVEEECGKSAVVAGAKLGEKTDEPKAIGTSGDPDRAYQAGVTIGTYLKELGINMDLAPVADLTNVNKSIMSDRSFGADSALVSEYVFRMAEGLKEQGITSCAKHFPGMGSLTTDTAKGVAVTQRTEEEFRAEEFKVFQALIDEGIPAVLISNLSAPGLTGDNLPCTLSAHVITDILRKEMNFNGLIISDALNEKAISEYYASDEAAVKALKAGCDMILMPEDFELAYNGVMNAVKEGQISEERVDDALRRIYRIKFADRVER